MKPPAYIKKKKKAFYKRKEFITVIIGLFFIMLMALGTVDVGLHNQEENAHIVEYEGLEFVSGYYGWEATTESGNTFSLTYNPSTLNDTEVPFVDFSALNYVSKIYVSSNPYDASYAAIRDFQNSIPLTPRLVASCYVDNDECADVPLRTCDNATATIGVIEFRKANETEVSFEDNCLTIAAKDLLKVTDKLILDYHGRN